MVATYPERQWREVPCVKPPPDPAAPAHGVRGDTVGNGTDYSAGTAPVIFAEGSFHHVTGVKSEYVLKGSQRYYNVYSAQLNSNTFATVTCKTLKSPNPSNCRGWEQFLFENDSPASAAYLYIQYWLINFGKASIKWTCPPGWTLQKGTLNCDINSYYATPVPPQAITSLWKVILDGAPAQPPSHQYDIADLTIFGSSVYGVFGSDWFPDLNAQWNESEFNVFGDYDGREAHFNASSTIVVRNQVDSGTTKAPACDSQGFTGEKNNLFFTGESKNWPKLQFPSIVFTETNGTHATPTCAPEGPG